jgi:hypothetical protein
MRLLHRERRSEHDEAPTSDSTPPATTDDTMEARNRAAGHDPTEVQRVADDSTAARDDTTATRDEDPTVVRDDATVTRDEDPTVVRDDATRDEDTTLVRDEPTAAREQRRVVPGAPVPAPSERQDQIRTATVRERTWTFAPGQIISFIAGVGLITVGLVAMLRAGIDGSFGTPVVEVLGYTHTAWLGLAEVGLGLLLVLAGSGAWGRPLSVLLGAATVVAGVLVVTEWDQMPEELGLERDYGWPLVGLGAVVALAAMALPVWRRRHVREADILDLRDDPRFADAKHPDH